MMTLPGPICHPGTSPTMSPYPTISASVAFALPVAETNVIRAVSMMLRLATHAADCALPKTASV